MMTKNYRTDADGKRGATKCATACTCKKPKRDRSQLAAPRTIDGQKLFDLAEKVYVHKTVTTIDDQTRKDFEDMIYILDERRLPKDYNRHPVFLAGVYLHIWQRKVAKVPTTTPAPKRSDERDARDEMIKASASAWRKTTKTK